MIALRAPCRVSAGGRAAQACRGHCSAGTAAGAAAGAGRAPGQAEHARPARGAPTSAPGPVRGRKAMEWTALAPGATPKRPGAAGAGSACSQSGRPAAPNIEAAQVQWLHRSAQVCVLGTAPAVLAHAWQSTAAGPTAWSSRTRCWGTGLRLRRSQRRRLRRWRAPRASWPRPPCSRQVGPEVGAPPASSFTSDCTRPGGHASVLPLHVCALCAQCLSL